MQNQDFGSSNFNNNINNNTNNSNHSEVVRSLLDEQFSKILVNLDQQQRNQLQDDDRNRASSSTSEQSTSASSSGFSSSSALMTGERHAGELTTPSSAPTGQRRPVSVGEDNSYILDLSRPGEARSRDASFEVKRSDPNNHHLPTCVRGSSKTAKKSSASSSTTTAKLKGVGAEKSPCQGKCCRPLYIIPPTSPTIEEDDTTETICKHRSTPQHHNHHQMSEFTGSRQHFDVINRIPLPGSSSASRRESGTSCDDIHSPDMIAGVAGRCPDCGRCRCARCVEQQPVTCCGDSVTDDCCVDVMSCMCCVKGIASFFASANPSPKRRQRRQVLPAPTGSTFTKDLESLPDSSDEEEDEGCCGLASANPCSCSGPSGKRTFRFVCLTFLTMFLPCLACYLPCRAAGRSVRWCYNRSRAPNACQCPRSSASVSSHQPTHQKITISKHQPRRYGAASASARSQQSRSQTAPACSSSSLVKGAKNNNHCSSSSKEKVSKRSSDFILCSGTNNKIGISDLGNINNNNNNNNSRHAKRW